MEQRVLCLRFLLPVFELCFLVYSDALKRLASLARADAHPPRLHLTRLGSARVDLTPGLKLCPIEFIWPAGASSCISQTQCQPISVDSLL